MIIDTEKMIKNIEEERSAIIRSGGLMESGAFLAMEDNGMQIHIVVTINEDDFIESGDGNTICIIN